MNTPLIEACVDSYASCRAAYRGGADRLGLCAHLVIGGTTPSTALFRQVQRDIPVKTNILIRPRFGDFLYSKEELEQMCEEIRMYRELGANGVVIAEPLAGLLSPERPETLLAQLRAFLSDCARMGFHHKDLMSFFTIMPLAVSPEIKCTDRGLVDVAHKRFLPLIEERRSSPPGSRRIR